jgi:Flp pilus assembly protein TadG
MYLILLPLSLPRRGREASRPGAAVECAVIAPFLAAMLLGMIEVGRGLIGKEILSDAAQKACRSGALPGKANSDVTTEVANTMSNNGITDSTTIPVNGVTADVSTANRFDKVSVKVAIPVS